MLDRFFFARHLDAKEEIVMIVHRHWLLGIKSLFWPSAVFIVVWSTLYFSHAVSIVYGVSLAALFILVWWIRNFMDYYLDTWIVTNKGIIDLVWHGWFHRSSTRVLYSDLQGVSYEVKGIMGTLVGYGHIDLEKISTGTTIGMDRVRNPRKVESTILSCMENYMLQKNLKDATTVQNILAEFVAGSLQKQEVLAQVQLRKKK